MKVQLKTKHDLIPEGLTGIILHESKKFIRAQFDIAGLVDDAILLGYGIDPDNIVSGVIIVRHPNQFKRVEDAG